MAIVEEFVSDRKARLDWLAFWCFGSFSEPKELLELLEEKKRIAGEIGENVVFKYGGYDFVIRGWSSSGKGIYRAAFQLETRGVYVGICCVDSDESRPQLKIELRGSELLQLGEGEALKLVWQVFESLGFSCDRTQVKRADICGDFSSFNVRKVFNLLDQGQAITQVRQHIVYRGERFSDVETVQVGTHRRGNGSGIKCRIYDKLKEVDGSEFKTKLVDELILAGQEVETLTRVEFEIGRDALKRRWKVDSVGDLLASLETIVEDLTTNWMRIHKSRLTAGNSGKKKGDEDDYHQIWRTVRGVLLDFCRTFRQRGPRYVEKVGQSVERKKRTAISYLRNVAATVGQRFESRKDLFEFIEDVLFGPGYTVEKFDAEVAWKLEKQEQENVVGLCAYFEDVSKPKLIQAGLGFLT